MNITPTDWLAKQLRLRRSITIHHGLQSGARLSRIARPAGSPVFAFVGRLVKSKGLSVLLEACKILSEERRLFRLMVIGDGPERIALETRAREWQLLEYVQFLGRIEDSRIAETLAKADLVVSPSLAGEVFGMVVAENMLRGIPVLASDLGAFVEVIGDAGVTFKTGDALDLARQMARFIDDPFIAEQFALRGRQRVLKSFAIERMVEQHAAIYFALARKLAPGGSRIEC
jgi:glycosyltransferase involved in cell wall biosynthesis